MGDRGEGAVGDRDDASARPRAREPGRRRPPGGAAAGRSRAARSAPARTAASMRSASIEPPSSSSRTSGWTLAAKYAKPRACADAARRPEHGEGRGRGEQPAGPFHRGGVGEQRGQVPQVVDLGLHGLLVGVVRVGLGASAAVPVAPAGGRRLPQMPAQRRVAVEAERHGETGHRGLADPGQLGQLHAGEERRVGGLPHHAVRDAALGRREPVPFEELQQPRAGAAQPVLLRRPGPLPWRRAPGAGAPG